MASKPMPFFDSLLPKGFPAIVQRVVPTEGFFIGQKEGCFYLLPSQNRSDRFRYCHIASIKRKVDGLLTGLCLGDTRTQQSSECERQTKKGCD